MCRDGAEVTSTSKSFYGGAPATRKARRPGSLTTGTRSSDEEVRSICRVNADSSKKNPLVGQTKSLRCYVLHQKQQCDIWNITRKPSYRWQTRETRKRAKNCSNSTCLQRCRWQYWPIFMRLAAVASEICEIPRNSLKIQTYEVQCHPRSSILVPIESPYVTCY